MAPLDGVAQAKRNESAKRAIFIERSLKTVGRIPG